jgi:asparagine synthase (glutamine-hydrolysing)
MTPRGIYGRMAAEGVEIDGPDQAREGAWHAVVQGELRWPDADLRAMARDRGQAAALLAARARLGDGLEKHLSGHFALALVDAGQRSVWLATDRMGTHPLAWAQGADGSFVFASRLDRLLASGVVAPDLDRQSLYDYAFFHMVPSPQTIWRGVSKLEPATFLRYDGRRAVARRWWQPDYAAARTLAKADLARELHPTLKTAVERCAPDERTGAFLSGGLDSSTVSGVLASLRPAATFSIGFGEPGYDEMHYARIASGHFDTRAHEHYVQPDEVADTLVRVAHAYDEPFGNSSAVPTLLCARLARSAGMTRLLAGDGGDEIFGGNERYAKQKVFERYHAVPALLRRALLEPLLRSPLGALPGLPRKARSYVDQARVPMPLRLHTYNFLLYHGHGSVFVPEFLAEIDAERPQRQLAECWAAAPTRELVDQMLYLDWKFTLADNDLRKVTRTCELEGIDVCYPMLDDGLVDLSLAVTAEEKVRGTELRHFYKRAMRGFLPDEVIDKTKHGFGLPFGEWLRKSSRLQELVRESLGSLGRRGFVRADFIAELLRAHREEHAGFYGTFVWVLVLLEQWLQAQRERAARPWPDAS